ncbi:unnamed protein product [Vicia faba]|uniref:Uncharacterized protein n=1 Tax=Vicia faba TaxID=3906 RepID=A0AAV0ZGU6_VICFA|nr:unnamed protein product [Vicia faba]
MYREITMQKGELKRNYKENSHLGIQSQAVLRNTRHHSFFLEIHLSPLASKDLQMILNTHRLIPSNPLEDLILKIKSREVPPNGSGEVILLLPFVQNITTVDWIDDGFVKKIRGNWSTNWKLPRIWNFTSYR